MEQFLHRQRPPTETKKCDYDVIDWNIQLLESMLIRTFPFLKENVNLVTKRIECLTVFHIHGTNPRALETFGKMEDDVVKSLMHIRLNEFILSWDPAFRAFSRKVAACRLNCNTENVDEKYLVSRANLKDTKRFMATLATNLTCFIPETVVQYFEIDKCKDIPAEIDYAIFNYMNIGDSTEPNKAIRNFLGSICFLNDNPGLYLTLNLDEFTEYEHAFLESLDRIIKVFYGLSLKYPISSKADLERLGFLVETFYLLLETESHDEFKNQLYLRFRKLPPAHILDKNVLFKCTRNIYLINFGTVTGFVEMEKELRSNK